MQVTWGGVFPAATTQFHGDQSLDLAGTAAHLEKLIRAGVHGLIITPILNSPPVNQLLATGGEIASGRPAIAANSRCSRAFSTIPLKPRASGPPLGCAPWARQKGTPSRGDCWLRKSVTSACKA